jgi:hypothetical protein
LDSGGVRRRIRYADLLHDTTGADVRRHGERHDLLEAQLVEREIQHGPRAFGRVALAPVLGSKTPADLHTRSEGCVEARNGQAEKPRERRHGGDLDSPQPEAMLIELRFDPGRDRVALLA